jgi:hypothetical protein
MKKLLYLTLAVASLASCSTVKYSEKVEGREIAQQCTFAPMTDSIRHLMKLGLVSVRPITGGNYEVCDSIYVIPASWSQAWNEEAHSGGLIKFFSGAAITASTIGTYAVITAQGATEYTTLALPFTGVMLGGYLMAEPFEWSKWNADREIRKADYLYGYLRYPAYRSTFWSRPAQSY